MLEVSTPLVAKPSGPESERTQDVALATLFAGCVLLLVAPIWMVHYPPLVDYPNHLARAYILGHLQDPDLQFSRYYAAEWSLRPYLTVDALIIALERIVPVEVAGKIVLTLTVVSIPIGTWLLVRKANPNSIELAFAALLMAYHPFLAGGFVNYALSIGLGLLTMRLWLDYFDRESGHHLWFWPCMLVTQALYFTHIMGFAVAGLLIGSVALWKRRPWRRCSEFGLAMTPGILFYVLWRSRGTQRMPMEWLSPAQKLVGLAEPLRTTSKLMDVFVLSVLLVAAAFALWRNRSLRWNRTWVVASAVLALIYVLAPDFVGTLFDLRLTPFLLVILLCVTDLGPRKNVVLAAFLLLFGAQLSYRTQDFRARQARLEDLAQSFQAIPPHARVLPIVESKGEPLGLRDYAHFWAYGVIQRGWYVPYMFQSGGVLPQPLRLLESRYRPRGFGWLQYDEAPDWEQVYRDYDYVWAFQVERFRGPLQAIGDLVYQRGELQVFRIRK